jgi:hypothetical protein
MNFTHGSDSNQRVGGDVLYVPGLAAQMLRSPEKGTSAFRSTVPSADAHIRDAMLRVNSPRGDQQSYAASLGDVARTPSRQPAGGSPSASHQKNLSTYSVGRATSPSTSSPSTRSRASIGSASFRSKTPIACAHINAMPLPIDPLHVEPTLSQSPSRGSGSKRPSASFISTTSKGDAHIRPLIRLGQEQTDRSGWRSDFDIAKKPVSSASFKSSTPIADAHIRALTRPGDSLTTPISDFSGPAGRKNQQLSASFKSNTPIADAHIRALTKPVDVCTAFADA